MDKAIEQLAEAVKQASPMLWAAAQAKVTSMMVAACFFCAIFGSAIYFGWFLRRNIRTKDEFDGMLLAVVSWMFSVLGVVGVISNIGDIVCMTIARDWYAIRALTELSPLR